MMIAGLDIETTGLTWGDHRIIEVYVGLWHSDTQARVNSLTLRINPERSIGIEAQRVHGIAITDLAEAPTWDKVAKEVHDRLNAADLLVAHNGEGFDLPFLNYEFERVGLPKIDKPVFDTMLEGRWATFTGAVPSLQALCFACDVPYDKSKAHAAAYDVVVMMECFFRAKKWGSFKPPMDIRVTETADAA
jgi:DNA polymerase-3 subunit epsilon